MSAYLQEQKSKTLPSRYLWDTRRLCHHLDSYNPPRPHLPSKRGQSDAGVWRPGDDVQQDDDQSDLRHLPLVLQPLEVLHRVLSPAMAVDAAVDLTHRT